MQSIGGRKFDLEDGVSLASDAENQTQVAGDQAGTTMDNLQLKDLDRPTTHDGDDMTENQVADPTGSPTSPVLKKKVGLPATSRTKGNPTIKKVL
jgi:hypothetical protein